MQEQNRSLISRESVADHGTNRTWLYARPSPASESMQLRSLSLRSAFRNPEEDTKHVLDEVDGVFQLKSRAGPNRRYQCLNGSANRDQSLSFARSDLFDGICDDHIAPPR